MFIRIIILFLLFSILLFNNLAAIPAVKSIDQWRQSGDERVYLFYVADKEFGKLQSTYKGEDDFDGLKAHKFEERLSFDYTALGRPMNIAFVNRHYVNRQGQYLGTDMNAAVDTIFQKLYIKRDSDIVMGEFDNGLAKQSINVFLPLPCYSIDNNMIDQLEMFLAFKNINIGDTLTDSVFIPQTTGKTSYKITVNDFVEVRYGDLFDSAYECQIIEPSVQTVYFTRDRRLIRLEQPSQNISVILYESPMEKLKPESPPFGFMDFIKRLRYYFIYLIIGGIFAIPVVRRNYKYWEIYAALILGGAMFPLVNLIQLPLQSWYTTSIMIPAVREGGSLYLYGSLSAVISGFVQETLKLIPILLIFAVRRPRIKTLIAVGMYCGIGFGIYEACQLTGGPLQLGLMGIISWGFFERIFAMLFHTSTGALLAYAVGRGWLKMVFAWLILAVIHSLTNYFIIFVHQKVLEIGVFELMIAFVDIIFAFAAYLIVRRRYRTK